MQKLKVAFSDFWKGFEPQNNFLAEALSTQFDWEISNSPDLLICSLYGDKWSTYQCTRILYSAENIQSDLSHFDASLTSEPTSRSNYYLPLYRFYAAYQDVFKPRQIERRAFESKKSIAAVFSNAKQRLRNQVYLRFAELFEADSGGKAFNNVGGPVPDKAKFIQNYKFNLAFENTSAKGYTTEKILEAYGYGTIPIYWGDPQIENYFNPQAFLHLRSLKDLKYLEEKIEYLLSSFEEYKKMYEEPLFPNNQEHDFLRPESVGNFLKNSVEKGIVRKHRRKVSQYRIYLWERRWKTKQMKANIKWLRPFWDVFFTFYIPIYITKLFFTSIRNRIKVK